MPQYCIGDAQIFAGSAANTARVMAQEQQLSVEDPKVVGNQAEFLKAATNRALEDTRALERNAVNTNPQALGQIRDATGQLVAAQGLANELTRLSTHGQLGPAYQATVKDAAKNLDSANNTLQSLAQNYPGSTAQPQGGARQQGPAQKGGPAEQQKGATQRQK